MQATQHNTPSALNGQQPNSDSLPFDLAQDVPLAPVLYDLLISSRKNGYGTTSHADSPILWWKMAGQPKEKPTKPVTLIHPLIQKRLQAYELVDTEVQINQVVRKYRKVEVQNV